MRAASPLPTRVEEIDTIWLDRALGGVSSSRVVEVIHGTATKVCVEVEFAPPRAPSTQRLWIKTGLEPHSMRPGMDQVYAGETLFYSELSKRYETRAPVCHFAATDANGISVVILEDLLGMGARFNDVRTPARPDYVARALTNIARRQAASWMAPELHANAWLRNGGSHRTSDMAGWVYHPDNWEKQSKRDCFDLLPSHMRDPAMLERALRNLQDVLWPGAPWAIAQGDCHYGQAYELPDGEVRFLDWSAVLIAHWCHDVSYFVAGALSPADRRETEGDLLKGYLADLERFGVTAPTIDVALPSYRASVLHGVSWIMCPTEMQPEENCAAMAERYIAATEELGALDLALALRP